MIKEFSNQSDSAIFAISTNNGGAQSIDITNVPDWARVTTSTTQITVEVDENLSNIKRSFDILVSNDCGLTVTLTISQKGKSAAEITCCIISDLSFTYPNAVDYSGGTATPQISYSITAYNSDGEEVEDTSSLTPIFLFSSKEGDGTFYMNDGTVEFGENTSFTVNPSREVELSVWIDGYKDSCEGSIATATATCTQNLAVAVVTCYTMTINSFTMNPSDISANGGESEPEIDYTVYELRNDGSKVRTEDTVDVSFNYDVTDGSGVFENGKIKFSESSSLKTDTHQINVTGRIDNYECGGIATSTTNVTQSGECYLTISPKSLTVIPSGGNAYLKVSSSSNFSVENLPSYASVVSQTDKLITFKFEANTTDEERSGTIKVVNECGEEETMTFKQPEPSITCYKIIAKSLTYNDVEVSGGTSTPHLVYEVYARTVNGDTLIEKPSFMTVSMEKVSGEDSTIDRHGNVSYNKNETYEEKETIVKATIGTMGKDFPICKDDSVLSITGSCKQEAAVECILNVSNNNITVVSSITSTSFTVTSSTDFEVTADEWITATKNGNTVNLTFSTNPGENERKGAIRVSNDCKFVALLLTQLGKGDCVLTFKPSTSLSVNAEDTSATVYATSSESTIDIILTGDTFIETVDTSGNQLIFKFDENTDIEARTTYPVIDNGCKQVTITITQAGKNCILKTNTNEISVDADATSASFTVTSSTEDFKVLNADEWITATKDGNTVNLSFDANTGDTRRGSIEIVNNCKDNTVVLVQEGGTIECTLNISPSNSSVESSTTSTSFTVTSSTDFEVTADEWITATKDGNTVNLTFSTNPSSEQRSGNVTVNNDCGEEKTFTLTQKAGESEPTITEIKMGFGNPITSSTDTIISGISLNRLESSKYYVVAIYSDGSIKDITSDTNTKLLTSGVTTACTFSKTSKTVTANGKHNAYDNVLEVRADYLGSVSNKCEVRVLKYETDYYLDIINTLDAQQAVDGIVIQGYVGDSINLSIPVLPNGTVRTKVHNGAYKLSLLDAKTGDNYGSAQGEGTTDALTNVLKIKAIEEGGTLRIVNEGWKTPS